MDIIFSPYDYEHSKQWILERKAHFHGIILAYLFIVLSTNVPPKSMARSSLTVRMPLALWNAILAVFSLTGFLKISPVLIVAIQQRGVVYTYTQIGQLQTHPVAGYWALLWVLSKVPELADTFFLLSRARPIRFMHWFHHAMSILFGTINFSGDNAYLPWVVWMNFFVHSLMYSYYFLSSLSIQVPRPLARWITTLQIVQFLAILSQLVHIAFLQIICRVDCAISLGGFAIGLFTTSVYLKLWANFFSEQYLRKD